MTTLAAWSWAAVALAVPYTASYQDGGTWDTIFGQGFNPYVNDLLPDQPYEFGEPVPLTRWEFFKSGEADEAADIHLAIIRPLYADVTVLNVNNLSPDGPLVGLSTNVVASTAGIATGDPIRFDFQGGLDLFFGEYYGAIMVNVDAETGNVTPVLVSALTADYFETEPGVFIPETNYDFSADPTTGVLPDPINGVDFNTSATNFMHTDEFGTFFDGFGGGGDANFIAYFDTDFAEVIPGDFDGNGVVNDLDLTQWQGDYGVNGESDADGDGDSDGADFLAWQRHFGEGGPALNAASAVPEPASLLSLGVGCMVGGLARGRGRFGR